MSVVAKQEYDYGKQRWCKLFYTLSFYDTKKLKWCYVREKRNDTNDFTTRVDKALLFESVDSARRYSYKINAPRKIYIHEYKESWATIQQIRKMKRSIDYDKRFQ